MGLGALLFSLFVDVLENLIIFTSIIKSASKVTIDTQQV